ncbi:MAG: hypothetical protein IJT94_01985, partial [Oscillibacter sp.]|nr:hypothetical protein [Oscillibacter sp.]
MRHGKKPLNPRGILCLVFCLTALLTAIPTARAVGERESKVVRVGWYESPFNQRDQFGRRSGYAY